MKSLSRVVWSEGMYLGPHQFQAQNRYFEDAIHFVSCNVRYQPYGLIGCALDAEALRNGTVSMLHGRGLFPDGLPFHMPECDPLPAPRAIGELFPPTSESVNILLAVPKSTPGGQNCDVSPDAANARYIAEMRSFQDETSGADERQVRIGRKNIRLLLENEPSDNFVTLPIARVARDGAGNYVFDPNFIAPSIQITSSERLLVLLRSLIGILDEKSAALAGAGRGGATDFQPREVANFWLLHAVNSTLAELRHLWTSKRSHPEEVFLELSRLAGALCTFSLDSHPRTLPLYEHERLGECFDALERHIRTHLEIIVPTNCVSIELTKVADCFYEGEIADSRCFGRSRWVFGIHAAIGEAELITKTPQLVKICSSKFVGELVKRAIAGLTLGHLPVPPPAIPAKVETQYFSLSKSGPFWDHIVQTKRIGIYVPGDLPDPELQLMVVLD